LNHISIIDENKQDILSLVEEMDKFSVPLKIYENNESFMRENNMEESQTE
jgi:hypothetical protein